MTDFLFRGNLEQTDPDVHTLIKLETERQYRRLILIPSESTAPRAVRECQASTFQNLYAEGYPDEEMRFMTEEEILDYPTRLTHYRRYSDPRYYKGVEYADIIESLARRRCAEAFATDNIQPNQIYVNVQPLSGAAANNSVYHALISPGDTIMGMNLLHGGHLTHGSSANRSGKLYKAVHYNVDPVTEKIDYDQVEALAMQHKPKVIVTGYSSYPWGPDWARFRQIADKVGAYLFADIAHIAGLVVAGVIPSPLGYAHVISFTTHKSLCGPRGACILTLDPALSKKIDRAVFPGEQGGPHLHKFAAHATAFRLAKMDEFRALQQKVVENCRTIADRLEQRGLRLAYGGTNTHLLNIDCRTIVGEDGTTLSGEMASRILDLAGIVVNRNTIPGDKHALNASGVRLGTVWITQRGLDQADVLQTADIIADLILAMKPYTMDIRQGVQPRAKIDFGILEGAKVRVRDIAERAGFDWVIPQGHGYPHFFYIDDIPESREAWATFDLKGMRANGFLKYAFSSDTEALQDGQSQNTRLYTAQGAVDGVLSKVEDHHYWLTIAKDKATLAATWLRDLSDGYVLFDSDIQRRLPGPVSVMETTPEQPPVLDGDPVCHTKAFFIGMEKEDLPALPEFHWEEKADQSLRRTPLYESHRSLGAKVIPFAGWEMPVWYTSVVEEHLATRQAAGLFDVAHMGVYQVEGIDAYSFLDSVCSNAISALGIGESLYTHFLTPQADVIDDTMVYHRAWDKYLVVVNASNDDKDWAWLNAVKRGEVMIDAKRPWTHAFGRAVILRNLRDPKEGADQLVDLAVQGPKSRDILLALGCSPEDRDRILGLKRTDLCEAKVGGFDVVVSRTGYTGEKMAFELFVHPDRLAALWDVLLEVGRPMGLKPCGLGARDSLRTEAGLPLYGHEMGGELNNGVAEAGYGSYVKIFKPWFIGRHAYIKREMNRQGCAIRFRFNEKGVRMAHHGDPILDRKGKMIGVVTSCAVDAEGFLTGQGFVEMKASEEGTPIFIFQSAPKESSKAPAVLERGDKVALPTPATVVSRFPKAG